MASARLIRSASHRRVRIATDSTDPERAPLLSTAGRIPSHNSLISDINSEDQPFTPYAFSDLPVYQNIWRIRRDILAKINDPYSLEQIRAPRLTQSVIRPLLQTYYELDDISIVFCLLVNRMQFIRDQRFPFHYQSVSTTRALVCEILASRLLRQYDEDSSGPNGLLLLSNIVIGGFDPFQGSPDALTQANTRLNWATQPRGYERQVTALEVAILSESKLFLSHSACQRVVDAIYTGRVVYSPTAFFDLLPDHYKHKPISIYDPRRAPLLNQYRLAVPRIRNLIEVAQFVVLLALYFWVMTTKDAQIYTTEELLFTIYTFGWMLDQLATILEHGWQVYSQNLWSFLDVTYCGIFIVYFILRMHGFQTHNTDVGQAAIDILAMAAPFLLPRLAFNVFSENLVFVALREMMSRFMLLMFLAVWSFAGFFLAMWWLSDRVTDPLTIGKWMIWVWFGLDGTGIGRSSDFHPILGPTLFISFAILGNTLFLTILVSTLSTTFAKINHHAIAEIQFRRAVLTFEGVKSDSLFSYPPPFNLAALGLLLPLKFMVSARWFHKVNITVVRTLNAPVLLLIGLYERRNLWPMHKDVLAAQHQNSVAEDHQDYERWKDRNGMGFSSFFHAHAHIAEVFDVPPEDSDPENEDGGPDQRKSHPQTAPTYNNHDGGGQQISSSPGHINFNFSPDQMGVSPRSHGVGSHIDNNNNFDRLKQLGDRARRISISLPVGSQQQQHQQQQQRKEISGDRPRYIASAFDRRRRASVSSAVSGAGEADPAKRLEKRLARIESLLREIGDAIEDPDGDDN